MFDHPNSHASLLLVFRLGLLCMTKTNSFKTLLQSSLNICISRKTECLGETTSYQKHMYELKYFYKLRLLPNFQEEEMSVGILK